MFPPLGESVLPTSEEMAYLGRVADKVALPAGAEAVVTEAEAEAKAGTEAKAETEAETEVVAEAAARAGAEAQPGGPRDRCQSRAHDWYLRLAHPTHWAHVVHGSVISRSRQPPAIPQHTRGSPRSLSSIEEGVSCAAAKLLTKEAPLVRKSRSSRALVSKLPTNSECASTRHSVARQARQQARKRAGGTDVGQVAVAIYKDKYKLYL